METYFSGTQQSLIFGVWTAPGARETLPKGWGRSPPPFGWLLEAIQNLVFNSGRTPGIPQIGRERGPVGNPQGAQGKTLIFSAKYLPEASHT